jgi:glycosyltransferase involved in cell wall biosynthesis
MFSILIPVYNVDVFPLVQALHEQANRLSVNFEIIVCDDGSTDEKVLRPNRNTAKLKNVVYMENAENIGRIATRNRLADSAQHAWLLFLDADVLPADEYFLNRYFTYLHQSFDVVMGGFSYPRDKPDGQFSLRWKFGRMRESISAAERNRKLYRVFISANYLIRKSVYTDLLSHLKTPSYGSDNLIASVFLKHKTPIFHIDNPVIHLGLESNKVFLKKSREAIDSLLFFSQNNPDFQSQNKLYRTFLTVKKLRMVKWVDFVFCLNRKELEKHLLEKNPSLFLFDLYRLGYLCNIHH